MAKESVVGKVNAGPRAIKVNRAPVLTPRATVVAEPLAFRREEALTLGRAVADLNTFRCLAK